MAFSAADEVWDARTQRRMLQPWCEISEAAAQVDSLNALARPSCVIVRQPLPCWLCAVVAAMALPITLTDKIS